MTKAPGDCGFSIAAATTGILSRELENRPELAEIMS